jgi:UDP-glucose 4-epimerase
VIDTNIAKRVVLTGASGFIAKHTIVQLFNAGAPTAWIDLFVRVMPIWRR